MTSILLNQFTHNFNDYYRFESYFCLLLLQRPGEKELGSQDRHHSSTTQAAAQLHLTTYAFHFILSSCLRLYLSFCFFRVFLSSYLISFHRPFSSSSFVFVFLSSCSFDCLSFLDATFFLCHSFFLPFFRSLIIF